VPRDPAAAEAASGEAPDAAPRTAGGYALIVRHPLFVRTAPLGFLVYGGMIAVQALWAGPWLTQVGGLAAGDAARGLFGINASMLCAFLAWGAVMPRLARRGITAERLMAWGLPLPLLLMALIVALGADAGAWHWAAWCVACTFVSVSQPAIGAAFPTVLAGRALSAFNLVIFAGVFGIQWAVGLGIDALRGAGATEPAAFRITFAVFGVLCLLAYVWFLRRRAPPADNAPANLSRA
jgi:hypothetical protein